MLGNVLRLRFRLGLRNVTAERRLPIGAQDAILPHISNFDFHSFLPWPSPFDREMFAKGNGDMGPRLN
jgi:hypothetical protein